MKPVKLVSAPRTGRTLRVEGPHFSAMAVFWREDDAWKAGEGTAPILRYMRGWTLDRCRAYVRSKGWTATLLEPEGGASDLRQYPLFPLPRLVR